MQGGAGGVYGMELSVVVIIYYYCYFYYYFGKRILTLLSLKTFLHII